MSLSSVARIKPKRARHFGVIINRPTRKVCRIFNPDFEFEFRGHHVGPDEFMLKIQKSKFGISMKPNSMTLLDVRKIEETFNAMG